MHTRMRTGSIVLAAALVLLFATMASAQMMYTEAPSLKAMVDAGNLPPVEERLPTNPAVSPTTGSYGGEIRTLESAYPDNFRFSLRGFWVRLALFNEDISEQVPELAESWEFNEDSSEMTVHLREGTKWSDGHLLSADDFLFNWHDYMLYSPDPEVTREDLAPSHTKLGGELMVMEKIDDLTFKVSFAEPNPQIWVSLSSVGRRELTPQPSHYLKPLHPKYNRDESVTIEEQWQALQHVVDNWQVTPTLEDEGFPSLSAWIPVSLVTGQRVELKRNPYYWKVDSEGKQLPYIDRAVSGFVEDEEIQLLQLTSGEVDFFLNPPDDPVLYQQQDAGNYNVTQWMYPIWLVWEVDYSYPARLEDDGAATADIEVAKLLTNPQFLRAMALGMDQPRYTEALYPFHGTIAMWWLPDGAAETSWPELAETKARMDEIYEFDPDKANQILDDLGLEKGEDGWRYLTGEDWRQRVEFNGITRSGRPREVVSRLAVEDIERNLGIKINIQASGRRSWFERLDAGRHQINMTASGPMFPSVKPTYHREWYYSNYDRHDLESTDPIYNRIVELDAAIIAETDPEKQRPLIVERIKLTADNYRETFMLTGKGFWPMAMSKDLKNVNQVTMGDDSYHGWPMQLRPETWSY